MLPPDTGVATGRGNGKLLLCGEHAVVYGYPAIALAVDRGTTVELRERAGDTVIHSPFQDDRLRPAIVQIVPPVGFDVRIQTQLPVGRGMGSSAALAIALVRAWAAHRGEALDPAAAYDAAMPVERIFHGNPSGVDVAVSAYGGCLWFLRAPGQPGTREPLAAGPWQLVVLDSGTAGDTAALVAGVRDRRPAIDPALERIGALVVEARDALQDPERLGALLNENHERLCDIGVSTPALNDLVALARAHGALGAKLSGAGGGGIVIALVREPQPLLRAARAAQVPAFGCVPWCP